MKIEYFKNKKGQWYFHMKAANGKLVAQSEGYKTKQSCLKTIGLITKVIYWEVNEKA